MALWKKILMGVAGVVIFVLGVALSDFVLHTLNGIFGRGTFTTKIDLEGKLAKSQQELEDIKAQLGTAREEHEQFTDKVKQKQEALDKLVKDIDSGIDPAVIKDVLLTTPSADTGQQGRIFLNPATGEQLLKPTTSDDPTVNEFKSAFNKKAKEILDVSKGILREKIGRLNDELVNRNTQLKEKNIELIDKLREVEQYKKELDEHKKQIQGLEGIKADLEKTVGVLETKIEQGRLRVSFEGDILFASGSHTLRKEGVELLEKVFPILKKNIEKNDIFVAGHTDNDPVMRKAKKYESNWDLSAYRAIEVVKYLIDQGLSPKYLTAAGYGEFKPVAGNDSVAGKAKNRRVELFLIPKIIKRTE